VDSTAPTDMELSATLKASTTMNAR
jgi:hypothetical protein